MLSVVCDISYVSVGTGESLYVSVEVAEVEVAVSVTVVCAVDEIVVAALDEGHRVLWLYIFLVVLGEDGLYEVSCQCVIYIEFHVLLASVEDLDEDLRAVRSPADVGEVLVVAVLVHLHICCLASGDVIYSELNVFRVHSGHRVFDFFEGAGSGGDVQEREAGHFAFVLAVECHFAAVWSDEDTSVDAEFVAAYVLAVGDFWAFAFSYRNAGSVCESDAQALAVSVCSEAFFCGLVLAGVAVADAVAHPFPVFEDSEVFAVDPAFSESCR